MNSQLGEITEWRGVEGLVVAKLLTDDNESGTGHGLTYGDVYSLAGVAEIGRTTASTNESHYYDNMPAVVISSVGADEVTIQTSAIDLDVLAFITGQKYDSELGIFIEGQKSNDYFALGYKTKKTNGDEVYVWRYKGRFNIPDSQHSTETDGTDANGQEVVFTGVSTTHKFAKADNKGVKAINVDVAKGLCDVTNFFETVANLDELVAPVPPTP